MDIRNAQRTGNMMYVYLPTRWCKKHGINSDSKLGIEESEDGSLMVSPELVEKKAKDINITLNTDDQNILQKVIMACYINPASSFEINLEKELDFTKLLQHKKLISIEHIEIDKKKIICESNVFVHDPDSLLRTMVRKTKNLLQLMITDYDKELIERYEEEIDRNKILIDKSIINAFMNTRLTKLKPIDLHYLSIISRNVESMVDHLITLDRDEKAYFKQVLQIIDLLKDIVAGLDDKEMLNYQRATDFIFKIAQMQEIEVTDVKSYEKKMIKQLFTGISEVLIDWAITKEAS